MKEWSLGDETTDEGSPGISPANCLQMLSRRQHREGVQAEPSGLSELRQSWESGETEVGGQREGEGCTDRKLGLMPKICSELSAGYSTVNMQEKTPVARRKSKSIPKDEIRVPCDHHLETHTHTRHIKSETLGVGGRGLCFNQHSR